MKFFFATLLSLFTAWCMVPATCAAQSHNWIQTKAQTSLAVVEMYKMPGGDFTAVGGYNKIARYRQGWDNWDIDSLGDFLNGLPESMVANPAYGIGYLTLETGSMYKTTDSGETWIELDTPTDECLYQSCPTADTIFVCDADKIYRSYNGGVSWTTILDMGNGSILGLSINSNGYGIMSRTSPYSKKIQRTTDWGTTWTEVSGVTNTFRDLYMVDNAICLGKKTNGGNRLWRSSNFGGNWAEVFAELNSAISPVPEGGIYIQSVDSLYYSTDGFATWTTRNNMMNDMGSGEVFFETLMHGYGWADTGYGNETGQFYETVDGGYTWSDHIPVFRDLGVNQYELYFFNEQVGFVYDSYMKRTDDGGLTWQATNTSSANAMCALSPDTIYTSALALQRSVDGGYTYEPLAQYDDNNDYDNSINGDPDEIYFVNALTGFAITPYGDLARTIDGGNTFDEYSTGSVGGAETMYWLSPQVGWLFSVNSTVVSTSKTIDGGNSWTLVTAPATPPQYTSVDPDVDEAHMINESEGWILRDNPMELLHTTNGGLSWSVINTPFLPSDFYFSDTQHGSIMDGNEYATTNNGGDTWSVFPFDGYANYTLAYMTFSGNRAYMLSTGNDLFINDLAPLLGDFNGDGMTSTADLLSFLGYFGCTIDCGEADINGDGVVNALDLILLLTIIG